MYFRIWIETKYGGSLDYYYEAADETLAYLTACEDHDHDYIMDIEEISVEEYEDQPVRSYFH